MKIAFFSESIADEAALKILVARILGEEIEETNLPNRLEYRSSSHLDRNLPAVISAVHYNSNAEALIIVSDSDDTPVHTKEHEKFFNERCRLCQLQKATDDKISKLREVEEKGIIKVAIGVPVPAIEAWYLCGVNAHINEVTWIRKQNGEQISYDRKSLKIELYGNDRPPLKILTEKAVESAESLTGKLEQLEQLFPQGFGTFAGKIRSWKL